MDAVAPVRPGSTILLTGATGFVGANLTRHLAAAGHRVIAVDVEPPVPLVRRFWQSVADRILVTEANILDREALSHIAAQHKPTAMVHAAVITAVAPQDEARMAARMVEVNVVGTLRVLELARAHHIRRVVYISSSGVYGLTDSHEPIPETAPLQIEGVYSLTKACSERLCLRWSELYGLDIVVGRLNGPYGPMERPTAVRQVMSPIYQLAHAALTHDTVRIRGTDDSYDFTYTDELARAIRLLLEADALPHRIYNLSNGQPYRLSDVMVALEGLVDGARFDWVAADEVADIVLSGLPRRGPLDISRLRHDVGYEPACDLACGLTAALPWWRAAMEDETRHVVDDPRGR